VNPASWESRLDNLAAVSIATGRATEAFGLMEQAAHIYDRMIGEVLAAGSERQSTLFLSTVLYNLYGLLSLVLQYLSDSPAAVHAALDLVLRRKAIAAEAVATQRGGVLGGVSTPPWSPSCARWPPCGCESLARPWPDRDAIVSRLISGYLLHGTLRE
jgi:hypothetical protein